MVLFQLNLVDSLHSSIPIELLMCKSLNAYKTHQKLSGLDLNFCIPRHFLF